MKNTIERALEKQKALEKEKENASLVPTPQAEMTAEPMSDPVAAKPIETPAAPVTPRPVPPAAETKPDIVFDLDFLERTGMVTPTEKFTTIKEEYRYIKRPLLNNASVNSELNHSNLIMVSSSFPAEGKTFTAINLAISIATEQDRQVLLIDADVINPHVCKRLGVEEDIGLLDYLKGEASIQDIIRSTNIPNLRIISAGTRSHHSNELLASEKTRLLMADLSSRYSDRICVFDTSPILGASETGVLSQFMGQAVIVVEEERTTHGQLERALSLLNPNMSTGLVLNKSKKSRKEYYGYYYARNH